VSYRVSQSIEYLWADFNRAMNSDISVTCTSPSDDLSCRVRLMCFDSRCINIGRTCWFSRRSLRAPLLHEWRRIVCSVCLISGSLSFSNILIDSIRLAALTFHSCIILITDSSSRCSRPASLTHVLYQFRYTVH